MDEEGGDDEPGMVMPTKRLEDIMNSIETKNPTVINLDACIKSHDIEILRYILERIPRTVRTVSLRFNNLGSAGCEIILEWLHSNESVLILYLMGSLIDIKGRDAIESAWSKRFKGHRTENMGYTFIRVDPSITPLLSLS